MNNVYIKVLYGPYEANGIIRHKVQKIYGLIKFLESESYKFEVQPSFHFNRLTIEMNERVIYTCDIRFMKFNMLFDENDILCKRIMDVIELHQLTFSQTGNVPKFANVTAGMRLQHRHDSTISLTDETSDIYSAEGELLRSSWDDHDGDEAWSMNIIDALRSWDKDAFMHQYVYNYGCIMQTPMESEPSEPVVEETKESTSTSSPTSCICLSVDPPSLYSVCYGPPTPLNTEVSKKLTDTEATNKDLNEEADATFNADEWKQVLVSLAPKSDETKEPRGEVNVKEPIRSRYAKHDIMEMPKVNVPAINLNIANASSIDKIMDFLTDDTQDQDEASAHSLYGMEPDLVIKLEPDKFVEDKEEKEPIRSRICKTYTSGGKCTRKANCNEKFKLNL